MRKLACATAAALSGTVIALLGVIPSASAATAAARPAAVSDVNAIPDINPLTCSKFTDGETYAEAYCPYPPGEFRVIVRCNFGSSTEDFYGPWEPAGGGVTSKAVCPVNSFYNSMGLQTVD